MVASFTITDFCHVCLLIIIDVITSHTDGLRLLGVISATHLMANINYSQRTKASKLPAE